MGLAISAIFIITLYVTTSKYYYMHGGGSGNTETNGEENKSGV
jgi:hypothetical protein